MSEHEVTHPVLKEREKNVAYLKEALGVDISFDIIQLDLEYADIPITLFLVDGFAKDAALTQIQRVLVNLSPKDVSIDPLKKIVRTYIPYVEIDTTNDLDEVVDQVLSGQTAFVLEGAKEVILVDTRTYPVRGPEEPDTEKVIRGAKDGFVETLVENAALMRRRVRDRTFRVEYMQIGRRSKTDISITYIEDIADPAIVKKIKDSLKKISTDGLPMGDKTIEEFVFGKNLNPYPQVRYTERPDVAATHLFEGHVLLIVDGSPSVMIMPTTFWHHLQHAEEYRQKPIVGASLRAVRFIAVWASIFLLPLWYLFATNEALLPEMLNYIGPNKEGAIPLFAQFLIAEIGIEMMRMAAIHTPNALATALGLVAAILIGEVAVEVGLFSAEVILYLAVAAVGTFATPSYEMSLANRLIRIALLILTASFGLGGYLGGTILLILLLTSMKVFETPYFWPFIPFSYRGLRDVLFRAPIPFKDKRPSVIHPTDSDR